MKPLLAIFLAITLSGCMNEPSEVTRFEQRLVVEGRIEQGRGAEVMLSLNTPYGSDYDSETLKDMVVRWAKVTIYCEGDSEVLTGRKNEDFPTQFIYTGSELRGEVGKCYTLEVEYSNQLWSATTTIPQPVELSDIRIESIDDEKYTITATLPESSNAYSIDCSLGGGAYYAPTLFGTHKALEAPQKITINRPLNDLLREGYSTYFAPEDRVSLRLNTLNYFAFDYWQKWENNLINCLNPVFPATSNPPTNISNNGIGIWAGYGTTYYDLGTIEEYIQSSN